MIEGLRRWEGGVEMVMVGRSFLFGWGGASEIVDRLFISKKTIYWGYLREKTGGGELSAT